MSERNADPRVVVWLGAIMVIVMVIAALQFAAALDHTQENQVKIQCFLHRDNADVHKLCVDHGYDR